MRRLDPVGGVAGLGDDVAFSYKTSWIAVRDRSTAEVADALTLTERVACSFAGGTALAYKRGIYVTAPISGWVLAHGWDLAADIDTTTPAFIDWLTKISVSLGDVQFFGTHRVVDWHQWASAEGGVIRRVYATADGDVPLFIGEPTAVEVELGVGTRGHEDGGDDWDEPAWEEWFKTMPSEGDVMRVAARWSIDPSQVENSDVVIDGVFGCPQAL